MVEAARIIGLSKKTLDDYSRCIRYGEQYGFNLFGRSYEKISVLRNFVKYHRNSEEEEKKMEDPDVYW